MASHVQPIALSAATCSVTSAGVLCFELRQEGHTAVALNEQCLTFTSLDEEKQAALDLNLKRRHLTPEQRAEWATRLRLHQGMSYPQIAETLGVSVGTVH